MPTPLTIGALSKRTGCNVETIRYYERIGLLPEPDRTAGNYRAYGTAQLERLAFVRRARALGFTLDEIRALLRLAGSEDASCADARDLAASHLADVRAKIADLRRMERVLKETVAQCADGSRPVCPLIEVLSRAEPSRNESSR
jgi:MerR family transcriptional regulator, mercuric resistance operon regulatory protein